MKWVRERLSGLDLRSVVTTLAVLAVLGVVGAAAVVGFGLYNVSARLGHLPGVSWVLHTTYRQGVKLRAPSDAEAPGDLTSEAMVALGAKHFDAACRVCHSAPGQIRTATMRAMVPQPPHITEAVSHWGPGEFHWILYEGIKMSGMPHWPAPRSEEVWPVVGFLMAVKGGMGAERYQALTAREKSEPDGIAYCATCHETTGVSGNPHIPRLDILSQGYMERTLAAYRSGERQSGFMTHAASEVTDADLARFARTYAAVTPEGEAQPLSSLALQGKRIAMEGSENGETPTNVPACVACHGPWPEPLDPTHPSLAGQYAPYLEAQLRLWRETNRGGTTAAELMHVAAADLTDADIRALAAWYASLAPAKLDQVKGAP